MSGWEGICEESAFTFNLDMLHINRTSDGQFNTVVRSLRGRQELVADWV